MEKPVMILGANSIGTAAKAIFDSNGIVIYGFLDDNDALKDKEIDDVTVLGKSSDDGFLKFIGNKCEAFVASDDNKERKYLVDLLKKKRKVMPVNAIHNSAVVDTSAELSHGTFINMNVCIGASAKIGNHCLIHSGAIIDTAATLGDFVQVGAGSIINQEVEIEDEVFIGSGSVIISGVKIGKGARIGAGSVVISSVKAGKTVFGNPATEIKN